MSNESQSPLPFAVLMVVLFLAAFVSKFRLEILTFYFHFRIPIALTLSILSVGVFAKIKAYLDERVSAQRLRESVVNATPEEDALLAGMTIEGKRIHLKHAFRRMHTQVVGTTNAGKTESVIIPWAVDDMKRGRGLLIVDGKSDRSLLDKIYAYAKRHNRTQDVRILSLCSPDVSHTFNPLGGGTPLEITERIFKALTFENEYYKDLQYEALLYSLLIFEGSGVTATPIRVVEFLRSPQQVKHLALRTQKKSYVDWATEFLKLSREEREQRTSGLISKLQVFTVGETASVFNVDQGQIDFELALRESHIIYCQLPVLKIPTLGKTTGKLILQALQGAIASRHLGSNSKKDFFSVYLDDFTEYLTEGFVSTLNKSRSANILVTFAHQALGDLAILGDEIKNTILTNANLKVFMRTNEPTSAEYFSEVIGTSQTAKVTERQTTGAFGGKSKTGEGSVREAEEFKYHPNVFKQELGTGEAVLVIPHAQGSLPVRLKLRMLPDIGNTEIPTVLKDEPEGLTPISEDGIPNAHEFNGRTNVQPKSIFANVLSENRKEAS